MKDSQKINIIGGGVAGLAAGIYGRLNGFDVTIFEMGQRTGGVCNSWEIAGYNVNGSIQWLVGSAPGIDFYKMWKELGVLDDMDFHYHDSFIEYKNIQGVDVHFYTDPNRLQQHLLSISPVDARLIGDLIHNIKLLSEANLTIGRAFDLLHAGNWTKVFTENIFGADVLEKYNHMSVRNFAKKFKSKIIKKAFENFWSPDMSMSFMLLQLSYAANRIAGYPIGGSGRFMEQLTKRYTDLGGKLVLGQKVTKILIEKNQAVGIQTEDSICHYSDYVISACDGTTVLLNLLEKNRADERTMDAYRTLETFPSLVYFSAGINRTFEEVDSSIIGLNIPLDRKLRVGNFKHQRVSFQIYNFDPTTSPLRKTLVTAILDSDYEYWKKLHDQGEKPYSKEKSRIGKELLKNLEREFPGISGQVDFIDIATPITYEKWTGNHNGSYKGWLPTPESTKTKISRHFPSLKRFYMAGHWVATGGGLPPAAYSGREAIQEICISEKILFEADTILK
ncbi:FAD-dependent oxidoreductase [Aquiflexum sp. TKW24L]|uniref:phytoene desaturase family protein n=1 Tax=Aquiflexum sp. TKW24L TaxID=2942212 RepID=UPI0020C151C0|nr:FAD-dependent oxidoreductase [Aquiflexum sp. TKW24L]MCL6259901.1 FAD-dependent oxidoreductase [Aquiflexum sp. TKW24L]